MIYLKTIKHLKFLDPEIQCRSNSQLLSFLYIGQNSRKTAGAARASDSLPAFLHYTIKSISKSESSILPFSDYDYIWSNQDEEFGFFLNQVTQQ